MTGASRAGYSERMPHFVSSSIGKKVVVAVTGLVLFGFVIVHMLGNLQVFLGREALNAYAEKLRHLGPFLWLARAVLLAALVAHVVVAARLSRENRAARPVRYRREATVQASYASRTMLMSGAITFLFVVYHLAHFTFGRVHPEYFHRVDALGRHDVYAMVVGSFGDPWVSAAYIAAMLPLAMHLSHGASSLFQSLGLNHPKYAPCVRGAGVAVALVVLAGNCSIPLAVLAGVVRP